MLVALGVATVMVGGMLIHDNREDILAWLRTERQLFRYRVRGQRYIGYHDVATAQYVGPWYDELDDADRARRAAGTWLHADTRVDGVYVRWYYVPLYLRRTCEIQTISQRFANLRASWLKHNAFMQEAEWQKRAL